MRITFDEFEELEKQNNKLDIETDYIPSMEDLAKIEKDPDRYAAFLHWLRYHHREPQTEEEKAALKKVNMLVNSVFDLTE